jgi:DNA repair exonuclease SbcCD nuclease subunit
MNTPTKILLLSDTHLGEDYPIRPRSERVRRGEDLFRNFEFVLDEAKRENVDFVVHGGDLFFRTKVHQVVVDRVYQIILDFANSGIPIIIVPGNHESSRLPTSLLLQHPNIYIFKKPEVFIFPEKNIAFAGFPFVRGNIRDQFSEIKSKLSEECKNVTSSFMCFHHPVEGCKVNPGNFTFRNREDTIQMRDIDNQFDAYLTGHIHPQQILYKQYKNKNIPVIFPGSTERLSFAEKNETKGYYILKVNHNSKNKIMSEFNTLQSRPMVDILIQNQNSLENTIDYLVDELSKVEERSIIRIAAEDSDYLKQIKYSFLTSLAPKGCIVSYRKNYFRKVES